MLQKILRVSPWTAIVMATVYASVETAVEAMRRGAFDYLPKPCTPDQVDKFWPISNERKNWSAVCLNWSRGW